MDEKELVKILKAVANENRFAILRFLRENKEMSLGDLTEITKAPFRSVSSDLAILRSAGLVQRRNHYSTRPYSIVSNNNQNIIKKLFQDFLE